MLKVDQREQIRRAYFIEGKSIRQIAREGHHDRGTVRKALRDAGPPHYTQSQPRARPRLGPFLHPLTTGLGKTRLVLPSSAIPPGGSIIAWWQNTTSQGVSPR